MAGGVGGSYGYWGFGMTGIPERIWADPPETFDDSDVWRSEPGGKGVEYIRADIVAAREAHLCDLIRRYVETVGNAEGVGK
jgi:hypothetical protein